MRGWLGAQLEFAHNRSEIGRVGEEPRANASSVRSGADRKLRGARSFCSQRRSWSLTMRPEDASGPRTQAARAAFQ